jgi:5-(carboxyamino)imidazole ribonucleotide synthase
MVNCVGTLPAVQDILRIPGAHLHVYGKSPRPRRKVGHVTLCAEEETELSRRVVESADQSGKWGAP